MRKVRRLFYLFMLCAAPFCGKAQELNARITVNGDKIATANKQIFTTLQNSLTEFVNNRKWTDATFAVNEKIDCTMTIIVNELDETNFKSEIQIQARRPVYNSSYTTTLLNFRDQQLDFEYSDFTSFSKLHTDVKTNICHITHAEWTKVTDDEATWVFTIRADRFLRNMVRAIVGTLIEVGRGKLSVEDFRRIIEQQDRCKAGTSAPGQALFLVNVEYPETLFI